MTKLQELDELLKSYRPTEKDFEWVKTAREQRDAFVAKFPISELDKLIHCHAELGISCDPLKKIVGLAFVLYNGTCLH